MKQLHTLEKLETLELYALGSYKAEGKITDEGRQALGMLPIKLTLVSSNEAKNFKPYLDRMKTKDLKDLVVK